jgi:uncharacterized membrane protein
MADREVCRHERPEESGMYIIRIVFQILLALVFIGAGLNHFRIPEFYANIIPDYLPWHLELVYVSGVCEILLGVMLLIPSCTSIAAWGIIALLIAVFPANIHMALYPDQYPRFSHLELYLRLPMQGIFIAWAYWFTRPARRQ